MYGTSSTHSDPNIVEIDISPPGSTSSSSSVEDLALGIFNERSFLIPKKSLCERVFKNIGKFLKGAFIGAAVSSIEWIPGLFMLINGTRQGHDSEYMTGEILTYYVSVPFSLIVSVFSGIYSLKKSR